MRSSKVNIVNQQIEKLKLAIAADSRSTGELEIEELTACLGDIACEIKRLPASERDVDAQLETALRACWGAMILARKAIESADNFRQLADAVPLEKTPTGDRRYRAMA